MEKKLRRCSEEQNNTEAQDRNREAIIRQRVSDYEPKVTRNGQMNSLALSSERRNMRQRMKPKSPHNAEVSKERPKHGGVD